MSRGISGSESANVGLRFAPPSRTVAERGFDRRDAVVDVLLSTALFVNLK
ncbi:hypothetical protein [Halobellus sp. H-GB7]|nr:hypothetical protein [Halobellus sp. H-GB7]MDQ2054588.1 hypothetical protein [Halobellus sp. H-GB7]